MLKKETIIFNNTLSEKQELKRAAGILAKGGIVVFPTETVYGLGANAFDAAAVKKIFKAKGRPPDNPLIVHIFDPQELDNVADDVPPAAYKLFAEFSPGPLTLVLNKNSRIPDIVTAGLKTVAVRVPSHPAARALLRECSLPIAAPSANRSGRPSPTTFEMALDEMEGRADAVINGGDCEIGLESTVVYLTGNKLHVLRPGAVTEDMLRTALSAFPDIEISDSKSLSEKPVSPGTKYTHYKPAAEVYLTDKMDFERIRSLFPGKKIGILVLNNDESAAAPFFMIRFRNLTEYARGLFRSFAELDGLGMDIIIAQAVEETGLGKAIMNRLIKACGGRFIA